MDHAVNVVRGLSRHVNYEQRPVKRRTEHGLELVIRSRGLNSFASAIAYARLRLIGLAEPRFGGRRGNQNHAQKVAAEQPTPVAPVAATFIQVEVAVLYLHERSPLAGRGGSNHATSSPLITVTACPRRTTRSPFHSHPTTPVLLDACKPTSVRLFSLAPQ